MPRYCNEVRFRGSKVSLFFIHSTHKADNSKERRACCAEMNATAVISRSSARTIKKILLAMGGAKGPRAGDRGGAAA